ncbi:MAG: hypothetical protein J3K34DRAFT_518218 [Monoraphidium minutum]|nr:MAG: hypothetical protein J3K34DRAFT_518218 [Monoraphidium minutum]
MHTMHSRGLQAACGTARSSRALSCARAAPRCARGGLAAVQPQSRKNAVTVRALGFDFGDSGGAPAAPKPAVVVGALQLRAASLLVYQSVVRGAVGEAFLAVLAATQKYQAKNSEIVGAYSKLYQLLMAAGHETWQDYVLDQILFARENWFARAAAQGGVDDGAAALEAAAYDLDMLQARLGDLAVSMQTVLDLVADAAPTAGNYYTTAAGSPSLRARARAGAALPAPPAGRAAAAIPLGGGGGGAGGAIAAPPTKEELAQWKAAIAGHERWGAAAPLLLEYHRRHGFGVTSRNSALRWNKGALEEAAEGAEGAPRGALAAHRAQREGLDANTRRHAAGLPAQHALVCGPAGSGKSWMLWEGTLAAAKKQGIRLVDVPSSELPNILDIARGCARYPRVRFILVADHVDLPLRASQYPRVRFILVADHDLSAGMAGAGGSGWPANTLLYLGASSGSTVSPTDPVVQRAGVLVVTEELTEQGFREALGQLLAAYQQQRLAPTGAQLAAAGGAAGGSFQEEGESPAAEVSDSDLAEALAWARRHCGGPSLRAAAMYARFFAGGGGGAAGAAA